ncbi:TVP38 TMEM64 family membrane slr0305-like [Olea europaea subsp. europaea]|uniref:TVP38 TMEM64 family membrane slr0305-like n=1 Tax=Olea europaea subsp. europaea TaxID=158383 RepID=A0A8S0RGZ3_OLEEU|nr:TVP38 TMEM64 family membrane slr0305-like [Olea europaea subsp. europaea]
MAFKFSWISLFRIFLLLLLIAAIVTACLTLPVEKLLKEFLVWIEQDLGPWGPLVLAVAYIPLTVLAVPASVLTLGGGYLFGLPVGFVADSIGATIGAGAAFLLGRTIGRSFVISKLKDYPQFRAVAIAIRRSGFKPITFALVYVGTTLKDLSDVTHGWGEFSKTRWALIVFGLVTSVVLIICVTRVAKAALEKALAENEDIEYDIASPQLPVLADSAVNLHDPLMVKIDTPQDHHEI